MSSREFSKEYVERHSIFVDVCKFVNEYNVKSLFDNEMLSDTCDIIFHFLNENTTILSIKTKNIEKYQLTYALAVIYIEKFFYDKYIDVFTDNKIKCITYFKNLISKFQIYEDVFFTAVRIIPMESVLTENILNYSIVDGNCDEFLSYLSILDWNCGIVIKE